VGLRGLPAVLAGLAVLIAVITAGLDGVAAPAAAQGAASIPNFGNPNGHFQVPSEGLAVDTSHPDHVIGHGSPAGCTSAAVVSDVAAGGVITFDCGPKPVTIVMSSTARVYKTTPLVVLDGGGLVTLSGGGKRRILFSDTCMGKWSTDDCVSQPYPQIVVQNITFEDGFNGAHQQTCKANIPKCWYGGVDGGGAIYAQGGQFKAVNSRFLDNRCYGYGPDLGGAAIRALAQYQNRPVYITSDTFSGGRCSNGGALSSIEVQWSIYNSVFTDNRAIGWGQNPAASGTLGGGSGGAVYVDGDNDNVLVAGTLMEDNIARECAGAVFDVMDYGNGSLTFNQSLLHNDLSGGCQNFPGVYFYIHSADTPPTMISSTDDSPNHFTDAARTCTLQKQCG
jgi:hypothetical protein